MQLTKNKKNNHNIYMKKFTDNIFVTQLPTMATRANVGIGKLINLTTLRDLHENPIYSGLFIGPEYPAIQNQNYGQSVKHDETPDGVPYIMHVDGVILIDLDNHNSVNWPKEETTVLANKLHDSIMKESNYDGYIWTELSKSGTGIHQIWYLPLCEQDSDKRIEEYLVNAASVYNKIANIFSKILDISVDDIFTKEILDAHNFTPYQKFTFNNSQLFVNPVYDNDVNVFDNFEKTFTLEGYHIYMQEHDSYLDRINDAVKSRSILPQVVNFVNSYLNRKNTIVPEVITGKLTVPNQIASYSANNRLVWDHDNRLKLVTTLCNLMAIEDAISIAVKLYDLSHNPDSSRSAAIADIKHIAYSFDGKYPASKRIIEELKKYGFIFEESKESFSDPDLETVETYQPFNPDEIINLSDNFYISDYYDLIIDKLVSKSNVYIKAGCGVGKSYFFKKLITSEPKVIIICHLNSIKNSVYANEICGEDNPFGVVIPTTTDIKKFIITNNLPDKLILGWDQYAELARRDIDLSQYIKCFDEIHNIVTTLSYRHSTTWSIISNRDLQNKAIVVSATPCGEHNAFCSNCYKIEFIKEKKYTVNYYRVENSLEEGPAMSVYATINNFVKYISEKTGYDKICIFDNTNHADFAKHWNDYSIHFYKGNRYNAEMVELMKTNILNPGIFITTTYGTEGIEIKNHINKLAVIIPVGNVITDVLVEQLINRFRDKQHVDVFFFFDKETTLPVDKTYDEEINNILKEIKLDNPDYKHWIEKENHYLSKWLLWPNTDIVNHLDTYPKMVMLYHNYILMHGITKLNITEKYPDIKSYVCEYSAKTVDQKDNTKVNKLIAKYPNLAFGKTDDNECREILNAGDRESYCDYNTVRYFRKLREYFCKLARLFGQSDKFMWTVNDAYKLQEYLTSPQVEFLKKMIEAFTTKGEFRFNRFKRFVRTREELNSETITKKQKDAIQKKYEFYNNEINRLGIKDDLNKTIFESLYWQIMDKNFNFRGEIKEKGTYTQEKFYLLTDPLKKFKSHEETFAYAKEKLFVGCSFLTWTKKGNWKEYFGKI